MMTQLLNPVALSEIPVRDRTSEPKHLEIDANRGSGRIVCYAQHIQTIEDIAAIEQEWTVIYANKFERFEYHTFGGWRKNSKPVSRELILVSCRCGF